MTLVYLFLQMKIHYMDLWIQIGNTIVPNTYLYIDYIFDKYFIAYKEGKGHGVIDDKGNTIVGFEYDILSKVGDRNLLKAVNMEKDGDVTTIFSKDLKRITTMKSMGINMADEYVEVYNSEKRLFINNNGEEKDAKEIFPNNKLYAFVSDEKWGFEDKNGNKIVENIYDYVTELNRFGFAGVRKDNKWAVMDENGKILTEDVFYFGDGNVKPEFLGKYYKTYKETGEIYYTNETDVDAYYESTL